MLPDRAIGARKARFVPVFDNPPHLDDEEDIFVMKTEKLLVKLITTISLSH